MIRIVNLRSYELKENEVLVRVDRFNKVLGNRFVMKSESDRDRVCDEYKKWFDRCISEGDEVVLNELRRIYKLGRRNDLVLGCWSYPRRCHSEVIKEFLEKYL